jgi:2,3-dihydroxyphenylpropionate 1,2-dioxygenase
VRCWIAAAAAWGKPIDNITYEPVPTWITGMACATAFPS